MQAEPETHEWNEREEKELERLRNNPGRTSGSAEGEPPEPARPENDRR